MQTQWIISLTTQSSVCHGEKLGKFLFDLKSGKHYHLWTEDRSGPAVLDHLSMVCEGRDILQVHIPYRTWKLLTQSWMVQNYEKGQNVRKLQIWWRDTHAWNWAKKKIRISQFKLRANQELVEGRRHDALCTKPCTDRGVDDSAQDIMTQVLGTLTLSPHHDPGQVSAFLWVM